MILQEGKTKFFLSEKKKNKGPGIKQAGFYNPVFELDRDLCVLVCQFARRLGYKKFLDGLGATGIRGLRIANEVEGNIEVEISEINPASFKQIERNVNLNSVAVKTWNMDVHLLCNTKKYDYIDIDPYGSPSPYVHSAFNGMKREGIMAFTATDKATLCGVYASVCKRRYGAVPMRGMGMKEIGLRILIGFLVRHAAIIDYAAIPLISYSHNHYFRVYLKVSRGAKKANDVLDYIKFLCWDNGWKTRDIHEALGETWAGPLWMGKIFDSDLLSFMRKEIRHKELRKKGEIEKLLSFWEEEENAPPYPYDSSFLCKKLRKPQPKMNYILNKLLERGFFACKTHFSPYAFKTDAPFELIKNVLSSKC